MAVTFKQCQRHLYRSVVTVTFTVTARFTYTYVVAAETFIRYSPHAYMQREGSDTFVNLVRSTDVNHKSQSCQTDKSY